MITPIEYRNAMARVAGAVHIVATTNGKERNGATAIAVASISDNPATLLVCLNKDSQTAKAIVENHTFTLNTLQASDQPIADIFAGQKGVSGKDKFEHGTWQNMHLTTSLVAFECALESFQTHHTHILFIANVVKVHKGESKNSLVYVNRGYKEV